MCGILAILLNKNNEITEETRQQMLRMSRNLRHRGPDANGIVETKNGIFLHERLSIIDPFGGCQPLHYKTDEQHLVLSVNGEIYNHMLIRNELKNRDYSNHYCKKNHQYKFMTGSDCEVINSLYLDEKIQSKLPNGILSQEQIYNLMSKLDGQFSFVLHDVNNGMTLVGRDPFGITPLYYGIDENSNILFASELKALEICTNVFTFESGCYMYFSNNLQYVDDEFNGVECKPYFPHTSMGSWALEPTKYVSDLQITEENYLSLIREKFEGAVQKRLMADVPFGVLLSGGLDSSLVASIAQKYLKENPEFNQYFKNLNSFSIGLPNSPDLIAAQKVADYIGTKHHGFTFTIEEGINALRDVIYQLETYDVTTIRASTPMYLLSRKIKSLGIKMVLSGEGSDELLGGYLYFHQAPSDEAHQFECKRRLLQLGYFDCLRANKSTMSWGLEARLPFLDTEFVNTCINIPKDLKGTLKNTPKPRMEKYILRKAFDVNDENGDPVYLPSDILWRQKEQFSDGVGYGWIDYLKEYTEKQVDNLYGESYKIRNLKYPVNTPDTKEAFYYRMIFNELFPGRESTVKKWVPMTEWEGVSADPSGRAQTTHI